MRALYEEGISSYIVRFETRGKEFTSVARLRKRSHSESESPAACKGSGCESARVTGVRPETGRSSPWQGEVQGNLDGGPLVVLRFKSLT